MVGKIQKAMIAAFVLHIAFFFSIPAFAAQEEMNQLKVNQAVLNQDVFVDSYISHEDTYLGEKVVVIYELYSRHNVDAFGITDYFAIEDMLIKDVTDNKPKEEHVYIKNVRFVKYEVLKLILEPTKKGEFIIPSFRLQANVIIGDSPVDGSGKPFSKPKPVFLQTEEMILNVLPLPLAGRPDNFTGIVGELHLEGGYNNNEVDYGDSVSVSITAYGDCNLSGLSRVYSDEVPGFTVYETLKSTTEYIENKQYYAAKEFELTLVPKKAGELDVAPFSIAYFNPTLGKYVTADIPGATITVYGDSLQPDYGEEAPSGIRETIRINQANYSNSNSEDDFIYIRISKKILKGFLITLAILLILTVAYIWFNSNKKNRSPAMKSLYRQMMAAKSDNIVYKHFNDMFKHLYFLNLKASSKDTVRKVLSDSELAKQVTDVMDYMESREDSEDFDLKKKIREIYLKMK